MRGCARQTIVSSIQLKRIYEPADPADGIRLLSDGVWPRGVKRDEWTGGSWRLRDHLRRLHSVANPTTDAGRLQVRSTRTPCQKATKSLSWRASGHGFGYVNAPFGATLSPTVTLK